MGLIRKMLPVLLGLVGLGIGMGAGFFLRPAAATPEATAGETGADHGAEPAAEAGAAGEAGAEPKTAAHAETAAAAEDPKAPEYVKLSNQFIVPVMAKGKVASMVILSLSLEVTAGSTPEVYNVEPKLRDAFLQVMFDHANSGGFDGSYTDGANLVLLRSALLEVAKSVLGTVVSNVLIMDIVRQDS